MTSDQLRKTAAALREHAEQRAHEKQLRVALTLKAAAALNLLREKVSHGR